MHSKQDVVTCLSLFSFLLIKIHAANGETFGVGGPLQSVAIERNAEDSFRADKLFAYGDLR